MSFDNMPYPFLLIPIATILLATVFLEFLKLNKKHPYRKKHHSDNDD